jgi:Zn-dependent protease with chaperone function
VGVYLLSCDEQQANAHWQRWLQAEPVSPYLAVLSTHSTPLGSESDPHTLFSIRLIAKNGTRVACVAFFLFGLALCELLTHAFPPIWGAAISVTGPLPDLLSIFLLLPWFVLAFSPSLTLGICYSLFRVEEAEFFKEVECSGVDIHPVVPTFAWVLFPKDMLIIQLSVFAFFVPRFLALLNLWSAISLSFPLLLWALLLLVPYEFVNLSRDYANKEGHEIFSVLIYWKLELLEKSRRIFTLFFIPTFFYCLMYICTQLHMGAAYLNFSHIDINNLSFSSGIRLLASSSASKGLGKVGIRDVDHIMTYTINHNMALSQVFGFLMVLVTISIFFLYTRLLRSRSYFKEDIWYNQKFHPALVPSPATLKSYTKAANIHIVLSSLWLFWMICICTVLLVLAALSMSDEHIGWLPIGLVAPFVWYRSVVRIWVGGFLSQVFLMGGFASVLLWLLMWLYSLVNSSWRSLTTVLSDSKGRHYQAKAILRGLCRQQKISLPLLHIDEATASWPMTTPLLPAPRFCVVHLSDVLAKELNDEQLTLVLAHELAHVTLHARKLWLIQLFSRLSVLGAGHLTLLLDYWKMELEADDFAARVTGNQDALMKLLEKLPQIELDTELRLRLARDNSANSVLSAQRALVLDGVRLLQKSLSFLSLSLGGGRLVSGVAELYKFHFGDTLWGALHPPYEVRAMNLRYRFDVAAKLDDVEIIQGLSQDSRDE